MQLTPTYLPRENCHAVGDVFIIGQKKRFTLDEASEILPTVRRVTERAIKNIESIRSNYLDDPAGKAAELEVQAVIGTWAEQIERLGCEPKGLWLVDFDNGAGYYCWRYPETRLDFFHSYGDGFGGRIPIS